MKTLLIIDNYPDTIPIKRLKNLKKAIKQDPKIQYSLISNSKLHYGSIEEILQNFDGFLLTGSPDYASHDEIKKKYSIEMELIRTSDKPILGICFGHQLIGAAFGSKVIKMEQLLIENDDLIKIQIFNGGKLFEGFDNSIESDSTLIFEVHHQEQVKYDSNFNEKFDLLASSDNCRIHAMKHKTKQIYGVQFHPETSKSAKSHRNGQRILQNFLKMI